ncbi:MAG: 50S ribosomal protein L18 [Nitrospirae bacterium]|nr:50S ribosomal protein L18 [Nitrospirota bacterium]
MSESRREAKRRRQERVRKKVIGTPGRLRLSVFRSLNHIYAQLIDDLNGHTLVCASSLDKEFKSVKTHKGNAKTAQMVGELLAKRALEKGIKKVVFDRSGYPYHGNIKALAESSRAAGLEF